MVDKELVGIQKDLKQKIQGLQNLIKSTIHDNKSRANDLRDDCNKLWDVNEELKSQTFQLRMKVEEV